MTNFDEKYSLSVGWVFDGSTDQSRKWDLAISDFCQKIALARDEPSVLNVNIVFHVRGKMIAPEFIGVRTGSFSRKNATLMVQVALPEVVPADHEEFLKEQSRKALDAAERWAKRRKVDANLSELRDILYRV